MSDSTVNSLASLDVKLLNAVKPSSKIAGKEWKNAGKSWKPSDPIFQADAADAVLSLAESRIQGRDFRPVSAHKVLLHLGRDQWHRLWHQSVGTVDVSANGHGPYDNLEMLFNMFQQLL